MTGLPQLRAMALLTGMWAASATTLHPQTAARNQTSAPVTLSGRVVDAAGKPTPSAQVTLSAPDSNDRVSQTGPAGDFTFQALPLGTYTITISQSGIPGAPTPVSLSNGTPSQPIQIVYKPATDTANKQATPTPTKTMDFSDEPNFTVAGVTDWTAVGGHGSDATLRTSEDLARETLALKPSPAASANRGAHSTGERNTGTETEKTLRSALASNPHSYAANHALGEFYLHADNFHQAVPLLKAASSLSGQKPDDEYALALACRGVGDPAEAREHIVHALAQKQSAPFHLLAGELDEALGEPLSAVRHEQRATELDPSEANYFAWGSELLLHRAIWQAAQVFANGAKAHPASARIKTGWGAALFAAARYNQAAQRLCEASGLAPSNREPYLFIGKVALASPEALPCVHATLERFLQQHPADADANYFNAMLLLKQTTGVDLQRVHALLQQTVVLDPRYADAYLQLGILAFKSRNYPEATESYQKAIGADPRQSEAHYRLGIVYDRTGKPGQAKKEFATHDELVQAQADAVEQQRRQVKQFQVVLGDRPAGSDTP